MPTITWPLASLPLPHRLALAEKRRDAFGGVFESEHAAELAFEHAQLRLELEILRAIERAQAERERGRAAIGELTGERHRRGFGLGGPPEGPNQGPGGRLRAGRPSCRPPP